MIKTQKGFSIIEFLLVVIALGVITFVGYYIYHNNHTKTSQSPASAKADPNLTAGAATAQAQKIYDSYYAVLMDGKTDPSSYFDNHPEFFTARYIHSVDTEEAGGGNPMICGQQLQYDGLTASNATLNGKEATVSIIEESNANDQSEPGSPVHAGPKVSLVYQDSQWHIDSVLCGAN